MPISIRRSRLGSRLSLGEGKSLVAGYRLTQVVGQGSFGEVWEARDAAGGPVALKFLRCDAGRTAAQEVRSILAVREAPHPHLVRVDRVWADRGYVVVVMELAEGSLQDLAAAWREEYQAPLPADQVRHYLAQAAEALDHLNARRHVVAGRLVGIQHCDVKPSNLLVCGEAVKLADFGLASALTAPLAAHRSAGTPAYAAPEVCRGQLSQWTDQYALAVSYCELRGGRRPFALSPTRFDAARPEPDLTMLPAGERPVLQRALSAVPQARWPSCGEMMARLAAS